MRLLGLLLNPGTVAMLALFASVVWMLKDEKDKSRPFVVFALVLNLVFPWLFSVVLGGEDSYFSGRYDHILARIDDSLGASAASIALPLQGALRIPLSVVYQTIIPMMICWLVVARNRERRGSLVFAYVAVLLGGPILYTIVPACGPIYAFGAGWLHPPAVRAEVIRLAGMPNAFPSLHLGTALVLVLFAQGKLWRGISLAFLAGTALATLSTGEHYVVDLIPGLVFGCSAACAGYRRVWSALAYLGVALSWSIAVRFGYAFLIIHPGLLRLLAALTVALTSFAVVKEWNRTAVHPAEFTVALPE